MKGMRFVKKSATALATLGLAGFLSQTAAAMDTLKIGTDLTYPPYNYLEGKEAAGFDAEFMHLVTKEMGVKPTFMDTRFANLIMGVNLKKFDVIASTLYVTPERAKQIEYIPYMKTGGVLLALKDGSFKPQKPEDLCGKKVSSIQGAAWINKLKTVSETYCAKEGSAAIDVREFPTSPEASQAVLSHAVDAQFEDAGVAKAAADKSGKLTLTSDIIYPVVVGLAVKKGNTELVDALKTAIHKAETTEDFKALLAKYSVATPNEDEITAALNGTL